jgi:hypothetical protein
MEGKRITRSIGTILSIGALLGGLSLAQPLDARDTQLAGARDSVVPIVVIDAPSQESPGRAQQADNQSAAKAKEATPGFDIATDGAGYFLTQLTDVPLAAWLLLATCALCAGFGPRALRRFEHDAEPTSTGPDQTRSLQKTSLTRPRRSPG